MYTHLEKLNFLKHDTLKTVILCIVSPVDSALLTFAPDSLQYPDQSHTSHILSGSHCYQRVTSLLITSVNQSDSGTYRCYAHNERGTSATALHLAVHGECWWWFVGFSACMGATYAVSVTDTCNATNWIWHQHCLGSSKTPPRPPCSLSDPKKLLNSQKCNHWNQYLLLKQYIFKSYELSFA